MVVYKASEKTARTTRGRTYHDTLARVCRCVRWGSHVTQRDVGHVRDETSVVGPGLSGRRDGFGAKRGTSHNNCLDCRGGYVAQDYPSHVPRMQDPHNLVQSSDDSGPGC